MEASGNAFAPCARITYSCHWFLSPNKFNEGCQSRILQTLKKKKILYIFFIYSFTLKPVEDAKCLFWMNLCLSKWLQYIKRIFLAYNLDIYFKIHSKIFGIPLSQFCVYCLCSSSEGRPFRLGTGANMDKVVKMDRDMTKVNSACMITVKFRN